MNSEKMRSYAPVAVRLAVAFVLLWFGSQQVMHTSAWVGIMPEWVVSLSGMSAATLVLLNGSFEIIAGLVLASGLFTRWVALLVALHLFHIMFTVGYSAIGVRDFVIAMSAFSVFLAGGDIWSLDNYFSKKNII